MKFVIQRVSHASVQIKGKPETSIKTGLLVFIGIHKEDSISDCQKWIDKILKLRIFPDESKPINCSIQDVDGEILIVSQFTLYADCKGQNRPSFMQAALPDIAIPIYNEFVSLMKASWEKTKTGEFGANMTVSLINDGPVTIILEN